jgi:hypothetical protein
VHGIKAFGFGTGQMTHLGSDDLQSVGLKTGIDFTDDILSYCVGFDDRKGTFDSHASLQVVI